MKLIKKVILGIVIGFTFTSVALADPFLNAKSEMRLTRAWKALSSQQRSGLRPNERVWIKYKDCLSEYSTLSYMEEMTARTNFLEDFKFDPAGALEGERARLDWHAIEQAEGRGDLSATMKYNDFAPVPDQQSLADYQQNLRVQQGNLDEPVSVTTTTTTTTITTTVAE